MNAIAGMTAGAATDERGYRPLPIRKPMISVQTREDGSVIIEQAYEMPVPWQSIPHLFAARAGQYPHRPFIAKRVPLDGGGWGDWRTITFGEAHAQVRNLSQAFLGRGIGPAAPVMAISGSSIEHGVLMLAAQGVSAPYSPISTGYSLLARDFAKLRHVFDLCRPKLIFAEGPAYAAALQSLPLEGVEVVSLEPIPGIKTTSFADLIATPATDAVDRALDAIDPDAHAKTIFTSGSTGAPKGVIQTQRMMTAVIAQHDALYIPDEEDGDGEALLSWMPWSHVGASNIMFSDVINDGACLYIDEGRPLPGQFEESLRNLREISPREFGSSPIFFSHIVAAMEGEPAFRDHFFSRLRYLVYSTAGLSQDLFNRLQSLSLAATAQRIPIITKYGSTETQGVTIVSEPLDFTGPIGLPFPGITVKLAPVGDKLEVRAKGDTITPGYLHNPEATAKAMDEEGFYCTGDAARFYDPDDHSKGLLFDGRVTENFKLATGTWVSVGALRLDLIDALSPLIQDCVIAGHDRDDIRVLAWLRAPEAAALAGLPVKTPLSGLCAAPTVRAALADKLAAHNAVAGGLSRRVAALILLEEPAGGDEIAEKGYINQRATLARRDILVKRLYAPRPDAGIILPSV
jgi:feruloyl-CoA synthase